MSGLRQQSTKRALLPHGHGSFGFHGGVGSLPVRSGSRALRPIGVPKICEECSADPAFVRRLQVAVKHAAGQTKSPAHERRGQKERAARKPPLIWRLKATLLIDLQSPSTSRLGTKKRPFLELPFPRGFHS